jgi:uncharacterized RDD family membrane protein YckC
LSKPTGMPTGGASPSWRQPMPPAEAGPPVGGPSGPRAGFWQRFAAIFIDGVLLGIVGFVVARIVGSGGAYFALSTIIGLAYGTILEGSSRGQTVGKMALGIRVFDFRVGGPIGYGRAFVRQIVKYVSALVFLLGYLWMLWDREKQCWHDKAAIDVVVPVSAYPV